MSSSATYVFDNEYCLTYAIRPSLRNGPPRSLVSFELHRSKAAFLNTSLNSTTTHRKLEIVIRAAFKMAPMPKHLTGDKTAINDFIDKFDVSEFDALDE